MRSPRRLWTPTLLALAIFTFAHATPALATLYLGADLSYVNEMEECGVQYCENGVVKDPFELFHAHRANLVRVRLWNDARWTKYSDLSDVKKTIARARAHGMQVLLDLHYCEDWADGEHQLIPKAWASITDPDAMGELETMVRRGRNHPCVILWSLGNEEPQQVTERGTRIVTRMQQRVRQLDPTRPTTFAMDKGFGDGVGQVAHVVGFNYCTGQMDGFHAQYPNLPIYGSETGSTVSVRGHYQRDDKRGDTRAYDLDHPWWAGTAEAWWSHVAQRPYIAGGFIWTGFDYRGEPTPYNRWPNVASPFGVLDRCGFPKDNYWYYRTQWTSEPVLHLFPHWNWDGLLQPDDNGRIDVWCHSNLEAVELLVNGVSQGMQQVPAYGHVTWRVVYAPGAIEARGYRGGKLVLSERRETTGKPAAIHLSCDRTTLRANAEDVAVAKVAIVDAQGRLAATADNQVQFALRGPARLIGVGNGDPSSHEDDKAPQRKAFNGLCAALLQTTRNSGDIVLQATAPGLTSATLRLPAASVKARASVG
ncbi:hypothetical protein XocBAI20_18900 [Xanthomonas oryzae pv. oryzicola]|nr:hypothetical protein XocBAI20_18900 [Xanthomonas oryzae pv. oryzicola]